MKIKMLLTNSMKSDPRVHKEASSLAQLGHEVEILAWDRTSECIDKPIEAVNGYTIRRFFGNSSYGKGYKQALQYLKYVKQINKYLKETTFDAIHAHDYDTLFACFKIKGVLKNKIVIYDQHDYFGLYFANRGGLINKTISTFINYSELKFINHIVDYHIVVTPAMKNNYKHKTYIVNNASKNGFFDDIKKYDNSKIIVGFFGVIRYYKELEILFDVVKNYSEIEVLVAGKESNVNQLLNYITENNIKNITLKGPYTLDDLQNLYKQISITYLVYPDADSKISMPNKFFESIQTETPIIINKSAELASIIEKQSLGWSVSNENLKDDLTNLFNKLISDGSIINDIKNSLSSNKYLYTWEENEKVFNQIYSKKEVVKYD